MSEEMIYAGTCPICGKSNSCHNLAGQKDEPCWCSNEVFPKEIFEIVPYEQLGKSCICKECLNEFKLKKQLSI